MPRKNNYEKINSARHEAYAYKPTREEYMQGHESSAVDTGKLSEYDRHVLDSISNGMKKSFSPEEFKDAIKDYLSHIMADNETAPSEEVRVGKEIRQVKKVARIPSVRAFCLWAGCGKSTFYNYTKDPQYSEMCETLSSYCHNFQMEEMEKGRIPDIPTIFTLKAQYGMVEAQPQMQAPPPVFQVSAQSIAEAFQAAEKKKELKEPKYREVTEDGDHTGG